MPLAIREKEREAAAKERNRHLLAKRREEKLRLKNQMEEEAKARDESVKEAERQRLQGIEDARLAKLKVYNSLMTCAQSQAHAYAPDLNILRVAGKSGRGSAARRRAQATCRSRAPARQSFAST